LASAPRRSVRRGQGKCPASHHQRLGSWVFVCLGSTKAVAGAAFIAVIWGVSESSTRSSYTIYFQ
jgi:hypothetical protein